MRIPVAVEANEAVGPTAAATPSMTTWRRDGVVKVDSGFLRISVDD